MAAVDSRTRPSPRSRSLSSSPSYSADKSHSAGPAGPAAGCSHCSQSSAASSPLSDPVHSSLTVSASSSAIPVPSPAHSLPEPSPSLDPELLSLPSESPIHQSLVASTASAEQISTESLPSFTTQQTPLSIVDFEAASSPSPTSWAIPIESSIIDPGSVANNSILSPVEASSTIAKQDSQAQTQSESQSKSDLESESAIPSASTKLIPESLSISTPTGKQTKSEKERFNYASFDCGALIRAANREASSSTAILSNSKDAYMLNQCSAKKFVEIELCDDILVDTLVLANFEFFSSMFKDFRVYVTDRYPPKREDGWKLIGNFTGRNVREKQTFSVINPVLWARHLRIEFISHYGQEYYCPLTVVKVYGTSMIEDVKADEDMEVLLAATESEPAQIIKIPEIAATMTQGQVKQSSIDFVQIAVSTDSARASGSSTDTIQPSVVYSEPLARQESIPSASTQISLGTATISATAAYTEKSELLQADSETRSLPVYTVSHPVASSDTVTTVAAADSVLATPGHQATAQLPVNDASNALPDVNRPIILPPIVSLSSSTQDSPSAQTTYSPTSTLPLTSVAPPTPTGTESIFKNIVKRLSGLEKIYSVHTKAIEDQSLVIAKALEQFTREQSDFIQQRLSSCRQTFDSEFDTMLKAQRDRMAELVKHIESQSQVLDKQLRTANQLIDSLDDLVRFS
eukprot:jgi/Hompol1/1914/HPOL_000229-RA